MFYCLIFNFVISNLISRPPDPSLQAVVVPLALFYGGLAQLIAEIWEFKVLNAFSATAFIRYALSSLLSFPHLFSSLSFSLFLIILSVMELSGCCLLGT
jgi:succinate-acetate transporter protein